MILPQRSEEQNLFFVFFALRLRFPSRACVFLPGVQFVQREPELLFAESRIGPQPVNDLFCLGEIMAVTGVKLGQLEMTCEILRSILNLFFRHLSRGAVTFLFDQGLDGFGRWGSRSRMTRFDGQRLGPFVERISGMGDMIAGNVRLLRQAIENDAGLVRFLQSAQVQAHQGKRDIEIPWVGLQ